jgi:hypothetical protein
MVGVTNRGWKPAAWWNGETNSTVHFLRDGTKPESKALTIVMQNAPVWYPLKFEWCLASLCCLDQP